MYGLTTVNIELSSMCQKACHMCGRRKIDKLHPEIAMNYGYMDFKLVKKIASQLPKGIVVQFHWNGEPLMYPRFGDAVSLFSEQITGLDTNAMLLMHKADEIIDNLDTLTVSVIEGDVEPDKQFGTVERFLLKKGDKKPSMIYRLLGQVDHEERWGRLPGIVANRIFHNPLGSFQYQRTPTKPEIGICLDLLNHLAIDRFGFVSCCVRLDPLHLGRIGNINKNTLENIWNGAKRKKRIEYHLNGKRRDVPLCGYCEYWGLPRG